MTPAAYTEDSLVQQTTAGYLEQRLCWTSVYDYKNEDFGPESLLGWRSDREVVLTWPLRAKLVELNPGLPHEAYDDAVRQIVATAATQSLIATNREKADITDIIRQLHQVVDIQESNKTICLMRGKT